MYQCRTRTSVHDDRFRLPHPEPIVSTSSQSSASRQRPRTLPSPLLTPQEIFSDDGRSSGPKRRESALTPYIRAIQAHRVLFIVIVIVTVAAATIWTESSTTEYESTAKVLVTPISIDNQGFLGFDLLRESGDPTRTVQTAAALLETEEAAEATAEKLGGKLTGQQLLDKISIQPEGESNVLDVTATADSPTAAAELADEFTKTALAKRSTALEKQVETEIERLEAAGLDKETENRIEALEALVGHGDPTLSLAQPATASDSPVGPSAPLVIILALIAGLALGTGAVVLLELSARRVRDEDEAIDLYPLPILARVPVLDRRTRRRRNGPGSWPLPPSIHEPFRTLLTQIQRDDSKRKIMFTSASTADGKTTSSINLAMTMAIAGHKTILLDTDLRKPAIAESLGLKMPSVPGDSDVKELSHALLPVPGLETLTVLAPFRYNLEADSQVERLFDRFPSILTEAAARAEYVIIDTPPLGEISDALRIADLVDELILVVYPGKTNRANFEIMRELLERSGDRPAGMLVIGDRTGASTTYYGYGLEQRHRLPSE